MTISGDALRALLEHQHGRVWDKEEYEREFRRIAFKGQRVWVRRRIGGVLGTLEFAGDPRFYYGFRPVSGR